MNIIRWFDINNPDHINAFVHLQEKGHWPEGFIPEALEIPSNWFISINMKLAQGYIKIFKDKNNEKAS